MSDVSTRFYMGQVTDNQCVIKASRVGQNIANLFRQTRSIVSLNYSCAGGKTNERIQQLMVYAGSNVPSSDALKKDISLRASLGRAIATNTISRQPVV